MSATADLSPTYEGQLSSAARTVSLRDGSRVVVEDCLQALPGSSASVVWNMTTRADSFEFDKKTGTITLKGKNPEGETKVLRMKVSLADKAASPGGFSVKRLKVNDEFLYPKLEKPADGCWFIRIKYDIKKGLSQRMTVEILPEMNKQ